MEDVKDGQNFDYIDLNIRASKTAGSNAEKKFEKEIDFVDIFYKAGKHFVRFFRWSYKIIKSFINFVYDEIKRNFYFFLIILIVGLIAGYAKNKLSRAFYQSSMLLETQLVSRAQIANRINTLKHYLEDENAQFLALELGIDVEMAESLFYLNADIIQVEVEQIQKRKKDVNGNKEVVETDDFELGPQYLRITVKCWDNAVIPQLTAAIENYVEKDEYVQTRLTNFQRNNLAMQADIRAQISQLAIFQAKNIEKSNTSFISGDSPMMIKLEEKTYVSEILGLENQILNLQSEYTLTKPVSVVQAFVFKQHPEDRLLYNLFISGMLSCFLWFFIVVIKDVVFRKKNYLMQTHTI